MSDPTAQRLAHQLIVAEMHLRALQRELDLVTASYLEAERDCGEAIDALVRATERIRVLEARAKELANE